MTKRRLARRNRMSSFTGSPKQQPTPKQPMAMPPVQPQAWVPSQAQPSQAWTSAPQPLVAPPLARRRLSWQMPGWMRGMSGSLAPRLQGCGWEVIATIVVIIVLMAAAFGISAWVQQTHATPNAVPATPTHVVPATPKLTPTLPAVQCGTPTAGGCSQ
jgi:hypothetical protein